MKFVSNPKEGYAFITAANYESYAMGKWPNCISVGNNYKVVSFAKLDEQELTDFVGSLGFTCQHLSAQETIDNMISVKQGPFVVYGQDVHTVLNHFNLITDDV